MWFKLDLKAKYVSLMLLLLFLLLCTKDAHSQLTRALASHEDGHGLVMMSSEEVESRLLERTIY